LELSAHDVPLLWNLSAALAFYSVVKALNTVYGALMISKAVKVALVVPRKRARTWALVRLFIVVFEKVV